MCQQRSGAEGAPAKTTAAAPAPAAAAGHDAAELESAKTRHQHFPAVFLAWCALKTLFQQTISLASISFIIESGFFVPFGYDAAVWPREQLISLMLPQAMFELIDLVFETWMTLRVQTTGDHLPWDSIVHHLFTAAYYLYVWATADRYSTGFLGLPVAGLSCQVIGVLYTVHRLKFNFRWNGLMLLFVQTLWRMPLAFVSLLRAAQFFWCAPWVHFLICALLANLDYRWTTWAYKLHYRMAKRYGARLGEEIIVDSLTPGASSPPASGTGGSSAAFKTL